jgi:hypothetical protein
MKPDMNSRQLGITLVHNYLTNQRGPGSVVGIVTGYELGGPRIESRWGVRFSAPVQTGPGTHPASCAIGKGSFPGVKSGRGVTSLLVPLVMKEYSYNSTPLWAVRPVQSLSACTRGALYLDF